MPPAGGQDPALAQLALDLGELRRRADLTWRELGARTNYHFSVVWRAARGLVVPTWEVTEAFVTVCTNDIGCPSDIAVWYARWTLARQGGER